VTDIVFEIAAASAEQSSGIEQVSKAVLQMDEATQQNAALVEEAAAASQSIVDQAQALNELVGHYRAGEEEPGAGMTAPKRIASTPKRPWARTGLTPVKVQPAAVAKKGAPRKAAGNGVSSDSEWHQF